MTKKLREEFTDGRWRQWAFLVVLTTALLATTFFVIREFPTIFDKALGIISSFIKALAPLWFGLILAYIIDPIVDAIDKKVVLKLVPQEGLSDEKKAKRCAMARKISIAATYLIIVAVIIAVLYATVALLVGQITFKSLPDMVSSLQSLAAEYEVKFNDFVQSVPQGVFSDKVQKVGDSVVHWFGKNFSPSGILQTAGGLGVSLVNFVIGLIISIYLLLDKKNLLSLWNRVMSTFLSKDRHESLTNDLREVDGVISKFLRGVLLDSLIIAIITSVGFTVIGLKFAIILGVFAGIANIIPYFGPIIGMVPAFFVGAFTADVKTGLLAVVVLLVTQQIDGNLIYPAVVGSSTGIKPLTVLLAVTIFGHYLGIVGMILAVPITSVAQLFISRWFRKKEEQKKDSTEKDSGQEDSGKNEEAGEGEDSPSAEDQED